MVALAFGAPLFLFLFNQWLGAARRGGQTAAEPFRIAGNFYYVGASDVTSFLIVGPEGHVLIDGGYPGTPPLILASIAKLGFDIEDVKVLLNSEPHFDHAGGLAELQKASGARLWASDASAGALSAGGADDANFWAYNALVSLGINRYDAPRVDHRVKDGEAIRLGPIEITAHITPGHAPGCTTWTFPVHDGDRVLNVVSACSLGLMPGPWLKADTSPQVQADFEKTFAILRTLPVDIWVTSHARAWGRYRKFVASTKSNDPVAPFIDREG